MTYKSRIDLTEGNFVEIRRQTKEEATKLIDAVADTLKTKGALIIHSGARNNVLNGNHIIYARMEEEEEETPK